MTKTKVTITHKEEGILRATKPPYLVALEKKWKTWTGIESDMAFEAIDDLSGNLFKTLRKLTAQLCNECETRKLPEDFKALLKSKIDEAWHDIIEKQKVGIDKLAIVVKSNLEKNGDQNAKKEIKKKKIKTTN